MNETTTPSASLVPNSAIIPTSKLENDSYDWWVRHEDILRVQQGIDPEIVLIGDSITHFWSGEPKANITNGPKAFESVFAPYRVLNMGFGWDRTQNVLWRLDHGEMDGLRPRIVILHIGTNNTTGTSNARENTPAEIVEGIAAICDKVRAKVPGVRIILMKIFPRGETTDHACRVIINKVNVLLEAFARTHQYELLDVMSKILKPDGTFPQSLSPDFCHPNEAGYQIWADTLRPCLNR